MVQIGDKIKITRIKQHLRDWEFDGVFEGGVYEIIDVTDKEEPVDTTMWFKGGWSCFVKNDPDFDYEIIKKSEVVSNDLKDKPTKHKELCEKLNEIYTIKNHDYGDSFAETYKKLGIISAITRITDKVNRLQSLCTKEQKVKDESIEDTLRDLANYALMTLIELEEEKKRDNKES